MNKATYEAAKACRRWLSAEKKHRAAERREDNKPGGDPMRPVNRAARREHG